MKFHRPSGERGRSAFLRKLLVAATIVSASAVPNESARAESEPVPLDTADHFSYSGWGDLHGLFGAPTVAGGTFAFYSSLFGIEATDGATATQSDTFSVDLLADVGWRFERVNILAVGEYDISDVTGSSVEAGVSFGLAEIDGAQREWAGGWAPNPDMPITSGAGFWYGAGVLDLPYPDPPISDSLHLDFTIQLDADAAGGGSAAIDISAGTTFYFSVMMEPVPEPNSLSLLALGVFALLRRRR